MKALNLIDQQFGKLVVEAEALGSVSKNGKFRIRNWICRCEQDNCKNKRTLSTSLLRSGKVRNCGEEAHGKDMPHRKAAGESCANVVLAKYKKRARQIYKVPFLLTDEEAMTLFHGDCHYCGCKPSNVMERIGDLHGRFVYNGIDRIDSSKGYEPGNVVSSCFICNRAKMDMSFGDFIQWALKVAAFQTTRAA